MNMVQRIAHLINDIHWLCLIAKVEINSKTEWRSFYDLILNHIHLMNGSYLMNGSWFSDRHFSTCGGTLDG